MKVTLLNYIYTHCYEIFIGIASTLKSNLVSVQEHLFVFFNFSIVFLKVLYKSFIHLFY